VPRERRRREDHEYEEVRRPRRRPPWEYENPWLWVGLLAILVAAGVLVAYFVGRDDDEPARSGTVTVTTRAAAQPQPQTDAETETVTTPTVSVAVAVPDVVGQTQLQAGQALQGDGLVPETFPVPSELQRGSVVAQNPVAGTELDEGEKVRLNISTGGGTRPQVEVPDVTGPEADDARLALWRAKLCVRTLERAAPSDEDVGEILAQTPSPGTSVQQYAQVTIYVGT
jgi:serine/threonine-protein kinase